MGVNLAVTLRADLGAAPWGEAESLESAMVEREVMWLVIASQNLGKFTIRNMDQRWRYAMKSGPGPMASDLTLELKEYY